MASYHHKPYHVPISLHPRQQTNHDRNQTWQQSNILPIQIMACNLAYTYPSKEDNAPITNKCIFI